MATKTLKIKQLVKRYTLEEVVEESNTVTYSTEIENEQPAKYIGFSVARSKEGNPDFTGESVISGSIYGGKIQLSTAVEDIEDYMLLKHIHCTGKSILNGEVAFV